MKAPQSRVTPIDLDACLYGRSICAVGHPDLQQREFVHAAPWSVAQQGSSNVSHGCINLSPDNAQMVL